ncbi:TPA: hypothetical protein GDO54_018567 [Pyxicephalus adspersus]|uniref:Uncharacterized protein n=1 Tax=Pyxicephalus adspersus TaxID=30357 RepID=A0AAV2ZF29_PYXAD|nr:TPA: hypothetical protein GDO54_018567 [Pyxicephalus adspersus]
MIFSCTYCPHLSFVQSVHPPMIYHSHSSLALATYSCALQNTVMHTFVPFILTKYLSAHMSCNTLHNPVLHMVAALTPSGIAFQHIVLVSILLSFPSCTYYTLAYLCISFPPHAASWSTKCTIFLQMLITVIF